jgi:hypothetical protein
MSNKIIGPCRKEIFFLGYDDHQLFLSQNQPFYLLDRLSLREIKNIETYGFY